MPDAPLSRRARRDMEAQAAERAAAQGDPTRSLAQGAATGEGPEVDAEGQIVSRRDRRRRERLARPMESWTAEEEMIATGQIPAMTPERIAEQEWLARDTAERAAVDAQTASSELRTLAQRDLEQQRPDEPAAPPVRVSGADVPMVQPEPRAEAKASFEEPEIVEPYSPRFELDDREMKSVRHESPSVEIPTGFDPDAKIERTPAPTGEPDPDDAGDQPTAWPESFEAILAPSFEEADPASAAPVAETPATAEKLAAEQAYEEAREAEAAAARAKVFEELFPPGSSQAALLAHDRREREAAAAAAAAAAVQSAESAESAGSELAQDDDEEAERQRGIEEIRRLTEAAISGFEKKSPPQDESTEPDSPQLESDQSESADRFEMPADPEEGPAFQGFGALVSPPEWQQTKASPMPDPGALAPPSGEIPTTPAPHQATFDETVRTASTEIPIRPMDQPQPTQEQAPSPWGIHPLDAAQASAPNDVNNFQPVSNAPRPDFSQLNSRPPSGQFPTTNGEFPTTGTPLQSNSGQFADDPSATGQIAPVRRTPDLPPVGGASHFKWLHLAVIGALVFVLGVVIYNVAWGQ